MMLSEQERDRIDQGQLDNIRLVDEQRQAEPYHTFRDPYVRRLLDVAEDNRNLKDGLETARKERKGIKAMLGLSVFLTLAGFAGGGACGYLAYESLSENVVQASEIEPTDSFSEGQLEQFQQIVSDAISSYEDEKQQEAAEATKLAEEEAAKKAAEEKAAQEASKKKEKKSDKDKKNKEKKESEDSE